MEGVITPYCGVGIQTLVKKKKKSDEDYLSIGYNTLIFS
jgi:hypothetical protein